MAGRDLTTGSIPRNLVALALPVSATMLLQSVYALVDLFFVRQLGDDAIAGLSISFQVFFLILSLSQVIGVTALAGISQAYGAGKLDLARGQFAAFSIVGAVIGLVAAVVAYASAELYVTTFTDDAGALEFGLAYFRPNTITFFLQLMLIVFGTAFRGSGDFIFPMKLMIVSVLANMVLDPLLIFGVGPFPELGIAGAAWATVAGQALALGGYLFILTRQRNDERALRWGKPQFSRTLFRDMLFRGVPAGFQFFLMSVVLGIVLWAMKPYGAEWTAAAGGGFRIFQQTILPLVAIGSAAAASAGQNFGAHHFGRVRETAWTALRWGVIYGVGLLVLLFIFARQAGWFVAESESQLDIAELYLQYSSPMGIAIALGLIPTFILQALGRAILPMLAAIARLIVLVFLVAIVIPMLDLGPEWVFIAAVAAAFIEGIGSTWLLAAWLRRLPSDPTDS